MAQNIRFSELVKKSGQPRAATLWTDPEKDAEFHRAIRENRVLTVKQETVGSKKDFGTVGFRREKNVSYLIFPKALPKVNARVVGIKYDLLREPEVKHPVRAKPANAKKISQPKKPREKEFVATVRRTAAWEFTVRAQAKNKTEAKKNIEGAAAEQTLSNSEALFRNEIRDLKESR